MHLMPLQRSLCKLVLPSYGELVLKVISSLETTFYFHWALFFKNIFATRVREREGERHKGEGKHHVTPPITSEASLWPSAAGCVVVTGGLEPRTLWWRVCSTEELSPGPLYFLTTLISWLVVLLMTPFFFLSLLLLFFLSEKRKPRSDYWLISASKLRASWLPCCHCFYIYLSIYLSILKSLCRLG